MDSPGGTACGHLRWFMKGDPLCCCLSHPFESALLSHSTCVKGLYRMSCQGTNNNGSRCTNVHYDGETSRSIGERFKEHISKYQHQKPSVRKTSVFYDHVQKEHGGTNPTVKLEILAQFHGNAAMRQAAEAVTIRDEKPSLNGKEENTNQPRKRRDRNRNVVSDVN